MSEQQFDFPKQHSTTHVVTDVHSQISKNLDNKQHPCVILLDFRKAFDTVNHQMLLRNWKNMASEAIYWKCFRVT